MDFNEFQDFHVVTRKPDAPNKFDQYVIKGDEFATVVNIQKLVHIEPVNTYEIYVCNPETGEGGWEIKHVMSTNKLIKYFPNFDCIITRNDSPYDRCESFLDWDSYLYS